MGLNCSSEKIHLCFRTQVFIERTMHLIKTSNIQTLLRTAKNQFSSCWVVVSLSRKSVVTLQCSKMSIIEFKYFIPTRNKKVLYVHRVRTSDEEAESRPAPRRAAHSWGRFWNQSLFRGFWSILRQLRAQCNKNGLYTDDKWFQYLMTSIQRHVALSPAC